MPGISFEDWNQLDPAQRALHRNVVTIGADHPLNNPDRPAYLSGAAAARILLTRLERELTANNTEAKRLFEVIRATYRQATDDKFARDRQRAAARREIDRANSRLEADEEVSDTQLAALIRLTTMLDLRMQQANSTPADRDAKEHELRLAIAGALEDEYQAKTLDPGDAGLAANIRRAIREIYREYLDPKIDAAQRGLALERAQLERELADLKADLERGDFPEDLAQTELADVSPIGSEAERIAEIREDIEILETDIAQLDELGIVAIDHSSAIAKTARLIDTSLTFFRYDAVPQTEFFLVRMSTAAEAVAVENLLKELGPYNTLPEPEKVSAIIAGIKGETMSGIAATAPACVYYLGQNWKNEGALEEMIAAAPGPVFLAGSNPLVKTQAAARVKSFADLPAAERSGERVFALDLPIDQTCALLGDRTASQPIHAYGFMDPEDILKEPDAAKFLAAAQAAGRLQSVIDRHNGDHRPAGLRKLIADTLYRHAPNWQARLKAFAEPSLNAHVVDGARFYDHAPAIAEEMALAVAQNRPILISADRQNGVANLARQWANAHRVEILPARIVRETEVGAGRAGDSGFKVNRMAIDLSAPLPKGPVLVELTPLARNASQANYMLREAMIDNAARISLFLDFRKDYHSANLLRLAADSGRLARIVDAKGQAVDPAFALAATRSIALNPAEMEFRNVNQDLSLNTAAGQLTLIKLGLTPQNAAALAERFDDLGSLLDEARPDRAHLGSLREFASPQTREALADLGKIAGAYRYGQDQIARAREFGADILTLRDRQYPHSLGAGVHNAPLYVAGHIGRQKLVALIGHDDPALGLKPSEERRLEGVLQSLTEAGYGILLEGRPGIAPKILETANRIPNAQTVVVLPHPLQAIGDKALSTNIADMLDGQKGMVLTAQGFGRDANRSLAHGLIAQACAGAILVQAPMGDRSLGTFKLALESAKPVAVMSPDQAGGHGSSANAYLLGRDHGAMTIETETRAPATLTGTIARIEENPHKKARSSDGLIRQSAGTWVTEPGETDTALASVGYVTTALEFHAPFAKLADSADLRKFCTAIAQGHDSALDRGASTRRQPSYTDLVLDRIDRRSRPRLSEIRDEFADIQQKFAAAVAQEAMADIHRQMPPAQGWGAERI